ncbi:SCO family protein [Kordiimonas marina]|uniref:SCO family protein n=1 Tax=Kordiimonas marina TaxID=2872312 RepID=UPI001FF1AD1D|nr:SCO family protein [Kordiimonas marina]
MTAQDAGSGPGGPFTLTSQTGQKVSDTDFRGRFMLVYFGYTYCPDVCPLELEKMSRALETLDKEGYDTTPLQPIFISIDPERDTVKEMAEYVPQFYPRLLGLTGTPEEIAKVAKEYKVYYKKRVVKDSDGYLMDHQSMIFVMGPDGKFQRIFSSRNTPDQMVAALRPVLTKVKDTK